MERNDWEGRKDAWISKRHPIQDNFIMMTERAAAERAWNACRADLLENPPEAWVKLKKERDAYAKALKVALDEGIFLYKHGTKARIQKELKAFDKGRMGGKG